jgi:hypothetical protein
LAGLLPPPLAGARLHVGELLHSFFSLFTGTIFASRWGSSSVPPTTMPCPGAAWPPGSNAAMHHARWHACSSEPPGQAKAPVGAARRPEHARATRAADELVPPRTGRWSLSPASVPLTSGVGGPLSAIGCRFGCTASGALSDLGQILKKDFKNVFPENS